MKYNKGIYIAGKLNADAVNYLHNVHELMKTAQRVKEAGFSILVPALDLLMGIMFGYEKYEDYFNNNLIWVEKSDAIFLTPGWETSKGTIAEILHAIEHGIPVFDRMDEMYEYFHGIKGGNIVGLNYEKDGTVTSPSGLAVLPIKYKDEEPEKYKKELEALNKKSPVQIGEVVYEKYEKSN